MSGVPLLIPSGVPSARTYALGIYEVAVTQLVRRLVTAGMGIVDVGAFCGYYSVLCATLAGPTGTVYAFEPSPATFGYLVRNIERNGYRTVVASNLAVTEISGDGELVLHRWPDHHWIARADGRAAVGGKGRPSVPVGTVALDDFFRARGWPPVDLVKLDVEGAEHAALRGMRRLVSQNPNLQMIVEVDERNLRRGGTTWAGVAATLRDYGFRTGYVIEQDLRPFAISRWAPARTICNVLLARA